jgi:hypothetical protein
MKLSARAAILAVLATSGVGAGISAAAATPLTPAQIGAAEQQAADTRVPLNVPLATAMTVLTGDTSHAGLHGSLPASPLDASAPADRDPHALLPDPLVAPLTVAHRTPDLGLSAPLPAAGTAGKLLKQDAASVTLPETLMDAHGVAASLGKPLTYAGDPSGAGTEQSRLDLTRLNPALIGPKVQSAPSGAVDVDQRAAGQQQPTSGTSAADLLATAAATATALGG